MADRSAAQAGAGDVLGLLRRAAAAQQAGRLAEADQLCRTVLATQPGNADALFLLAGAAAAAGRPAAAIDLLRQAIARNPERADFHGNLGAILGRLGRLDEAIECFRAAIRLEPAAAGHLALGNALGAKGDLVGAVASFRAGVAAQPANPAAHVNLGNALRAAGRLDESAASLREAVRLDANLPEAQHNLGVVLFTQGHLAEAESAFRTASRLKPDSQLAFRQLALVLIASGRLDEAARFLIEPVRQLRRPGAVGDAATFRQTNRVKLQHDADQLSYLRDRQVVPGSSSDVIAEHRALLAQMRDDRTFEIAPAAWPRLAAHYNRLINVRDTPARSEGALSRAWDGAAIEREYRAHAPGFAWFDGLLTAEAWRELWRFCVESTIWFQMTFKNEVSATLFNGFCCPLLLQIAQELRQRLPDLLGDKPLALAWAYKYCGPFSGLGPHADDGAVAVNFWLTPDEANEDPERGGLVIWDRLVPEHYLRRDRAAQAQMIQSLIEEPGTTAVAVPYRCNRAAIFDGMIVHSTDQFRFKDGYENRRINVTLLYGRSD